MSFVLLILTGLFVVFGIMPCCCTTSSSTGGRCIGCTSTPPQPTQMQVVIAGNFANGGNCANTDCNSDFKGTFILDRCGTFDGGSSCAWAKQQTITGACNGNVFNIGLIAQTQADGSTSGSYVYIATAVGTGSAHRCEGGQSVGTWSTTSKDCNGWSATAFTIAADGAYCHKGTTTCTVTKIA